MRHITVIAAALTTTVVTPLALARPAAMLQIEPRVTASPRGHDDLMRQWATVGRCVVGRDRAASLAFVRAEAGSDDASDAARRLDPVFATCLAGSRVPGPSSIVLRRAAVANALGIARRSI